MRKTRILFTSVFILLVLSLFEICFAEDFQVDFQLLGNNNDVAYNLKIVFPDGLYEYYADKSHRIISISDLSDFVTPYIFESVANKLWEVNDNDEDFTNSILTMVHQIEYEETTPVKYPIETMFDGKGDCDLFSLIAASIAKAGGLDVVLLYYEQQTHMNVGVQLVRTPRDARDDARYVTYENNQYYVAECTGENWMEGWRVGECPPDLKDASVEVISLDGNEQIAPGQASASFTSLDSSVLTLDITPSISLQNTNLNLIGQLQPTFNNQNITLYASVNNSEWIIIDTATTNTDGYFQYLWENRFSGVISIRASWFGNANYASSVSTIKNVTVIPFFVIELLGLIILGIIGISIAILIKKSQNEEIQQEYW